MTVFVKNLYGRKTKNRVNLQGLVTRIHTASYRLSSDVMLGTAGATAAFVFNTGIDKFTRLSDDPLALCRSIDADEETHKEPFTYLISVEWSTETPGPDQTDRENDDPFSDAVEIDADDELITFPLFKDLNGKMIANTVGDPIGGIEQERSVEIIRFSRNEPRRDYARDRAFRYSTNLNSYSGAPKDTLKMRSIKSKPMYRNGIAFWRYTYEMAYREDKWQPSILNAGMYQLVSGSRVPCVDRYNEPVSDVVPLTNAGVQVAQSALPNAAVFNDFVTLQRTDFAALGLPS